LLNAETNSLGLANIQAKVELGGIWSSDEQMPTMKGDGSKSKVNSRPQSRVPIDRKKVGPFDKKPMGIKMDTDYMNLALKLNKEKFGTHLNKAQLAMKLKQTRGISLDPKLLNRGIPKIFEREPK
jgi:hypothetical protein